MPRSAIYNNRASRLSTCSQNYYSENAPSRRHSNGYGRLFQCALTRDDFFFDVERLALTGPGFAAGLLSGSG